MAVSDNPRSRRVLLSAYACDPDEGSESGAGWAVLTAIAEIADEVVVVTRHGNAPRLEIQAQHLPATVRVLRVATPFDNSGKTYRRYLSWIWAASPIIRRESESAQIFHHATFASDWMIPPVLRGLARRTRFVWGPAGGNTYPPLALVRKLPRKFAIKEVIRWAATKSARTIVKVALRHKVHAFIALNEDSARSAPRGADILYHSNCVLPYNEYQFKPAPRAGKTALFVGRLIDLKGLFLVQEAFQHLDEGWHLRIIGDGPLRKSLEDWAAQFHDRVSFLGWIAHSEIMHNMANADVLLFPGLHDTAPWASAEAAAAGLPVVSLNLGGVSMMAGANAIVVEVEPMETLALRLALAVESAPSLAVEPQRTWTLESMSARIAQAYGS
jgi:glycosyltransferase involved in cell wall biosynthesis